MSFIKHLKSVKIATKKQKENELWDVEGILKQKSNKRFKFDLRPMNRIGENQAGKKGSSNTKADKMVFEIDKGWFVVDVEELHQYLLTKNITVVNLETLLSELEWNIYVSKI